MLVVQVFLFKDGQFLGNEMATGERLEIGRDPACDILLDDDEISRRHAILFEHDGRLAVQDAGSHLGTMVNGQTVSTPRYIGTRDDVGIGRFTLKFKPLSSQPGAPIPTGDFTEAPAPTVHFGKGQDEAQLLEQALSEYQAPPNPAQAPAQVEVPADVPAEMSTQDPPPGPVDNAATEEISDVEAALAELMGGAQAATDPMAGGATAADLMGGAAVPAQPPSSDIDKTAVIEAPLHNNPFAKIRDDDVDVGDDEAAAGQPGLAAAPHTPPLEEGAVVVGTGEALLPGGELTDFPGMDEPTVAIDALDEQAAAPPGGGDPRQAVGSADPVELDAALDAAFPESFTPAPVPEARQQEPTHNVDAAQVMAAVSAEGSGNAPLAPPPGTPDSDFAPSTAVANADTRVRENPMMSGEGGVPGLAAAGLPPEGPLVGGFPAEPPLTGPEAEELMALTDSGSEDVIPTVEWAPSSSFFDDDDEEDEDDPLPTWSLAELLTARPETEAEKESRPIVEVVHLRGERVLDHAELDTGQTYKFGRLWTKADMREAGIGKPINLVKHKKGGEAELVVSQGMSGSVMQGGEVIDLATLAESGGGKAKLAISGEGRANVILHGQRVTVRMAKAPKVSSTEEMIAAERARIKLILISLGIAVGVWLMLFAIAWIAQYRALSETVIQLEDEGFAEVIEELELEEPEPEPEEPKMVEPEPVEKPPPEKEKVAKAEPVPQKEEAPKKPGVLDALKSIPKAKAGNQSLTKSLSNIKGVRVPGASSFKVSAMTGKGPKGVQIGGASGGVDTNSLNSILRRGGGANLTGKRSRKVKGRVKTLKRSMKQQGKGILSKEEIQKVINKNVGKIQYCYEKQLRMQPGLSGKVVLEWTIGRDGRVKSVKSNRSTLKSPGAINCMSRSLKGWKFPKPRGDGVVIVKYPFIFNTL